jgi:hypothetical protein
MESLYLCVYKIILFTYNSLLSEAAKHRSVATLVPDLEWVIACAQEFKNVNNNILVFADDHKACVVFCCMSRNSVSC